MDVYEQKGKKMKKSFDDLTKEERQELLKWAQEGLEDGVKRNISMQINHLMHRNLIDPKKPFSLQELYDRLHDRVIDHWKHIIACKNMLYLENELLEIEDTSLEIENPDQDLFETPKKLKKPRKKAKK